MQTSQNKNWQADVLRFTFFLTESHVEGVDQWWEGLTQKEP